MSQRGAVKRMLTGLRFLCFALALAARSDRHLARAAPWVTEPKAAFGRRKATNRT